MKFYYIRCPHTTWGQTEAGCHASSLEEIVIGEVGIDSSLEEIEEFFRVARPEVCIYLPGGEVRFALEASRVSLASWALLERTRSKGSNPYVSPASWGQNRFHVGTAQPSLAGPTVSVDTENLAYQRSLR